MMNTEFWVKKFEISTITTFLLQMNLQNRLIGIPNSFDANAICLINASAYGRESFARLFSSMYKIEETVNFD